MFFNKKDPIIMGVDVARGILRPGTPICLYDTTVNLLINLSIMYFAIEIKNWNC